MNNYPDEIESYKLLLQQKAQEDCLSSGQLEEISYLKKSFLKQQNQKWRIFNILNLFVLVFLICSDFSFIYILRQNQFSWVSLSLIAILHGWIIYSATVFTLHEGAAHKNIFKKSAFLSFISFNFSRLFFADPVYYVDKHFNHHKYLGEEKDGAFTFLVRPLRVLISFLPLSGVMPYCDYKIHSGVKYTRSKVMTDITSLIYHLVLLTPLINHSLLKVLVFIIFSSWAAFILDRLRESLDHSLLDYRSELNARSLGMGILGWTIGGGPWGQPCHLSHHLAPSLNWYYQIKLHYALKKVLKPNQRSLVMVNNAFSACQALVGFVKESRNSINRLKGSTESL